MMSERLQQRLQDALYQAQMDAVLAASYSQRKSWKILARRIRSLKQRLAIS